MVKIRFSRGPYRKSMVVLDGEGRRRWNRSNKGLVKKARRSMLVSILHSVSKVRTSSDLNILKDEIRMGIGAAWRRRGARDWLAYHNPLYSIDSSFSSICHRCRGLSSHSKEAQDCRPFSSSLDS